jgi:hypothetical protein
MSKHLLFMMSAVQVNEFACPQAHAEYGDGAASGRLRHCCRRRVML